MLLSLPSCDNKKDSFKAAKNREIATIIGGIWGMSFLLFEKNIYYIQSDLLRHLVLSLMLIPIIKLSVWFKQTQGTFLMCVVFLCITVTHGNDVSPVQFALNRIIDTTIGICTALLVNCLPLSFKMPLNTHQTHVLPSGQRSRRQSLRPR